MEDVYNFIGWISFIGGSICFGIWMESVSAGLWMAFIILTLRIMTKEY